MHTCHTKTIARFCSKRWICRSLVFLWPDWLDIHMCYFLSPIWDLQASMNIYVNIYPCIWTEALQPPLYNQGSRAQNNLITCSWQTEGWFQNWEGDRVCSFPETQQIVLELSLPFMFHETYKKAKPHKATKQTNKNQTTKPKNIHHNFCNSSRFFCASVMHKYKTKTITINHWF